ncbi:MAG: NADH-quinone oxidoreductase subunit M [Betaproteobacteria bacterium]|nr:NADH-quinone oxidoreductase subunit M [Betaproteobacteria bacterium]
MLLSLLIWVPLLGGCLLLGMGAMRRPDFQVRVAAAALAALVLVLAVAMAAGFDSSVADLQMTETHVWIESYGINYALGVDGISMPLIVLNAIITLLAVVAGWESITRRVAHYMGAFLLMCGFVNGVFAAADAILFYVFWEATLIPLFLVIGVWGGERRVYAAIKFFLYTLLGSLLMLVALLYLGGSAGEFSFAALHALPLAMPVQALVFFAFLAAFAVKVPMVPVHTWLPDAHVEAPTGGSIVLAAVMLKLGGYGFLRLSLPIVPDASQEYAWLMIVLSLIAIVYIGLVALAQKDMKKLVAYSSIAHMGFVTLGLFVFDELGMAGAMVQMISHGFVSGAMFFCIGVLYDRMHTRQIGDYGGVANTMPVYAAFLLLFAMANAGLPGTSGFVGEFMVILAALRADFWVGVLAATTLITGAAYTLWMYKRAIFGSVANDAVAALRALSRREAAILGAFAAFVLLLGIWPQPLAEAMAATVDGLLAHVDAGKLPDADQAAVVNPAAIAGRL